jgi:uncharacterized protein YaaQ
VTMKVMTVIVQRDDTEPLADALRENGQAFTIVGTTGGFLRQGNTTLFMAIEENRINAVLDLIQTICKKRTKLVSSSFGLPGESFSVQPVEVQVGGAVVFVMSLDQFVKY